MACDTSIAIIIIMFTTILLLILNDTPALEGEKHWH